MGFKRTCGLPVKLNKSPMPVLKFKINGKLKVFTDV